MSQLTVNNEFGDSIVLCFCSRNFFTVFVNLCCLCFLIPTCVARGDPLLLCMSYDYQYMLITPASERVKSRFQVLPSFSSLLLAFSVHGKTCLHPKHFILKEHGITVLFSRKLHTFVICCHTFQLFFGVAGFKSFDQWLN